MMGDVIFVGSARTRQAGEVALRLLGFGGCEHPPYIKCSHAQCERIATEVGEANRAHAFEKRFALWKLADAGGQILVRVARFAREEPADSRQHIAKVPAVNSLERLARRRGEF